MKQSKRSLAVFVSSSLMLATAASEDTDSGRSVSVAQPPTGRLADTPRFCPGTVGMVVPKRDRGRPHPAPSGCRWQPNRVARRPRQAAAGTGHGAGYRVASVRADLRLPPVRV
jgi:hypothetical protein